MTRSFFEKGWCHFSYDPVLAAWVSQTLPAARKAVEAEEVAGTKLHRIQGAALRWTFSVIAHTLP